MAKTYCPNYLCNLIVLLDFFLALAIAVMTCVIYYIIQPEAARVYATLFFAVISLIALTLILLGLNTLATRIILDDKKITYRRLFWSRSIAIKKIKSMTELKLRLPTLAPHPFIPRFTMNAFQGTSYDLEISGGNTITLKDRDFAFFIWGHYDKEIVYIHDIRSFKDYKRLFSEIELAVNKGIVHLPVEEGL